MDYKAKTNPVKDAVTAHKLIHKQDFNLLRAQKTVLNNMLGKKKITESEYATIEGMLSLIDAIQDIACDGYGYNPNDIFNFTNEVDNTTKVSLHKCRQIVLND